MALSLLAGPELLLSDVILYINYELLARKLGGLAVLERHFPLTVAWFDREGWRADSVMELWPCSSTTDPNDMSQ